MEDVEMTAEQEVKKVYPGAVVIYCNQYDTPPPFSARRYGFAVFIRCPDLRSITGVHNSPDDAWADALRRIEDGGKA